MNKALKRAPRRCKFLLHHASRAMLPNSANGAGDGFVNVEPLADRCRANGWRIEPPAIRISVKSYSCAAALGS